ncbi:MULTISPECIES: SPOR domain-containing protein [Microbacterium]|uniref:SPOR domain-containing protein n=1 Tax=Microbacterium TaxID=33882 RepID=UPI00217EBDB1|nr:MULTISPECIES: SPOR domain-containing protein [Microbacterium]UWF78540.1 SPOR domain-containing protein [Microbacterium neungamense]WCM56719.1 SPOR domain-containing protein [Microbacterium sp. EF45047]
MPDGDDKYWFNLSTREVEYGMLSPAVDRVGPFDTREEAEHAPEKLEERSRAWAEEEAAEDAWGSNRTGSGPDADSGSGAES